MVLKVGSNGPNVRLLQKFLGLNGDGNFGPVTEAAVKKWQQENGLTVDGVVGPKTWDVMGIASTDNAERLSVNNIIIEKAYMPVDEYKNIITPKEYLFLHHTAGWHNPFKTIEAWAGDDRGAIATEFVIGGPSIKGTDTTYDGKIVAAFPPGNYGWHLGAVGSQYMHTHSVGIEICNFGWLNNGKTYTGNTVVPEQRVQLAKPFRGYRDWHRYSNEQLESLRDLILYIANRDNIDVRAGLVKWIQQSGVKAFDFNQEAYNGQIKGLLSHGSVRRDKNDVFPQQELIDMLLTL